MSDTIRLSDIVGRSIAVEWFEAVAIVRAVSERVREELAGLSVPDLHHVGLHPDGRLSFEGAVKTDEPVKRLGQLLQALLVSSSPPVQLRLISSQATAPLPAFPSIGEYLEALAYFERPDRPAVLRALYERCADVPLLAAAAMPALDTVAPIPTVSAKAEPPAVAHKRRPRTVAPAVAAAVTLVVGGAAYWRLAPGAASGEQVGTLAVKASDALGAAVVSGISTVSDKVGLGRLAPATPTAPPPAVAPASPGAGTGASAVRRSAAKGTSKGTPSKSSGPTLQFFDLDPPTVHAAEGTIPPVAPLPPEPEVAASPKDVISPDVVFSATDADVSPPIGVRPQLPIELPAGIDRSQLGQIELIVLPDGTVGAVRLLTSRRRIPEAMLLSAAKAWRFLPAKRDGQPVSYRKIVWLALQ